MNYEVRELTSQETDTVSGGAIPWLVVGAAVGGWFAFKMLDKVTDEGGVWDAVKIPL